MKLLTGLVSGLFVFCTVGAVSATPVIDQSQTNALVNMANFSQTDLAQSFQQTSNNIVGAGIFLQPNTGTSDIVTISLWSALPTQGGTLLATGSNTGSAGTWDDIFWSSVSVTPNTTYYLVFSGNTTLGISGSIDNPYSRGQVYANSGYGSFPTFDYTFRTYADSNAVPEPATMLLFGAGLVGLATIRRKKTA